MHVTPELQQAACQLKQKALRAEWSRTQYEQTHMNVHRRSAEFDSQLLIRAAIRLIREWEGAKMPSLRELLDREQQHLAATAAGA